MSKGWMRWCDELPESELGGVLQLAMQGAAQGLAGMAGRPVRISALRLETVPIAQIATHAGNPETEVVGVYLLMEGDCSGQAILMFSLDSALRLANMLLERPLDAPSQLEELECSALAEVGNLMVSYFLNAVAAFLKKPKMLQPSPPNVMVDMLGAILQVVATPLAAASDDLLLVEAAFVSDNAASSLDSQMQIHFWVLPNPR